MLDLPSGHAINIDAAGLATIDTTPLTLADLSDPLNPRVLAQAPEGEQDENATAYQHNTLRPDADRWVPRTKKKDQNDPMLRPGELILGNGETNFSGTCNDGSGPFASWSATTGIEAPLQVLDVFRPVSGSYDDGDPAINARLLRPLVLEPRRRTTATSGWRRPGTSTAPPPSRSTARPGRSASSGSSNPSWARPTAHWVDDQHIYVIDYAQGIDILRYDPASAVPTTEQLDASWLAKRAS